MASKRKAADLRQVDDLRDRVLRAQPADDEAPIPERRHFERAHALVGALLEAVPLNDPPLGTVLLDMDGELTLDILPSGQAHRIVIVDLSAGGLKGASSVAVPRVGSTVIVRLFFGEGEPPISILAEVVWTRPLDMPDVTAFGLRFIKVPPTHARRIDEILARSRPKKVVAPA